VIQPVLDRAGEFLIKVPQQAAAPTPTPAPIQSSANQTDQNQTQVGVDPARARLGQALKTFGEGNAEILGTDAVSAVASSQLRTQAIAVTVAALIGMLLFIAFRFEWTYGASAVIAVFHTVLVTLGLFSIFQIEINLTVIAALLTLVGFDVNDSIVIFDRIRENRKLYRRMNLYDVTNLSINQTLSRTVITSGLVFLSVVSLVLLGGETLRPFSLALLMGILFGTYDTIAVAGPIMVWWERRLASAERAAIAATANTSRNSPRSGVKPSRAALAREQKS